MTRRHWILMAAAVLMLLLMAEAQYREMQEPRIVNSGTSVVKQVVTR